MEVALSRVHLLIVKETHSNSIPSLFDIEYLRSIKASRKHWLSLSHGMLEEDAIMYHVIAKNFFGVCLISVFFWAESVSSRWSSEPHINGRCRKQRISLIKLTGWHDGQLNPNYILFMTIWVRYVSFASETSSAFVLSKDSGMSTISSGGMTSNARCCECGISSAIITRPHPNQWPTSWHYAYVHLLSLYRTLFSVL